MSDLRAILLEANVRTALIVDDAYDVSPRASDLSAVDADGWALFFDDLNEDENAKIRVAFPQFDAERADDLSSLDGFVAALWSVRDELRPELAERVFGTYQTDVAQDLGYLATVEQRLTSFGLVCRKSGREFAEEVANVDLVLLDLFLGIGQDTEAVGQSIAGLRSGLARRLDDPPLVILMSRSPRLEEKKEEFRDSTGLFESAFRIISKSDLAQAGRLEQILERLARYRSQTGKLATFLHAWKSGVTEAAERTTKLIRTLDLPDHAQIRDLLLSAEGEALGAYLVDVFDRVLQHEIERDAATIDAATALNDQAMPDYPPPYIAGSRNLQGLMHRVLFQNTERLRLKGSVAAKIAFGDILRVLPDRDSSSSILANETSTADDVWVVLSPACDLQRKATKRVLLLAGQLKPLDMNDWVYADTPTRTPIVSLSDDQHHWIKWDLKHIDTRSHEALEAGIGNEFEIVARMRESHALELQQKLLSNLGRVGQLAQMPGTFPVRVKLFIAGRDKKAVGIGVGSRDEIEGVCYVGRGAKEDERRIVLAEDACAALNDAVIAVDPDTVHPNTKTLLAHLKSSGDLVRALSLGVYAKKNGTRLIASPSGTIFPGSDKVIDVAVVEWAKQEGQAIQDPKAGVVISLEVERPDR